MAATTQPDQTAETTRVTGPPPGPGRGRGKKDPPRFRVAGDALPFPVAVLVLIATAVAMNYLPRRWADVLALAGIAVCALAADFIVTAKARATMVTLGCCLGYVGVVSDGDWLAGWGWMLVPLGVLFWLTVIIGYRPLLAAWGMTDTLNTSQDRRDDAMVADLMDRVARRDERAVEEGFRATWPRITSTWGIGNNTTFIGWRKTARGGRVDVRTSGSASAVIPKADTIAARVGVPKGAVRVTLDDGDNSVAHIYVDTRDPLAEVQVWTPPPLASLRVSAGARLVRLEDGSLATIPLTESHGRICGTTRSGKTKTLEMICAEVIAMPDAVLIIVDLAKQCADFVRYWPHAWMVARRPEEAVMAFTRLLAIGEDRMHHRAERAISGTHVPTAADPQYVVIIDEAPTALAHKPVAELVGRLALESSGWGVTLLAGISNPHGTVISTTTRGQFGTKVGHVGTGPTYHKLVFDVEPSPGRDATDLPFQTGHCFLMRNGDKHERIGRTLFAPPEHLDRWARTVPPVDHVTPHPHLTPTPPPTEPREPVTAEPVAEPVEATYTRPHLVPDPGPELTGTDRQVYDAIAAVSATGGRILRAELARRTSRDGKTIRAAVDRLLAAGHIVEDDKRHLRVAA